jgi:hypothetical protein
VTQLRKHALFRPLGSPYSKTISWSQDALPTHPAPPPPPPAHTALPATGGNATGKEDPSIIVRPEDAADEGAGPREPAKKRARMVENQRVRVRARLSIGAGKGGGEWTKETRRGRQGEAPTHNWAGRGGASIKGCTRRDVIPRGGGAPERGWCMGGAGQACEKTPKTFRSRLVFFNKTLSDWVLQD